MKSFRKMMKYRLPSIFLLAAIAVVLMGGRCTSFGKLSDTVKQKSKPELVQKVEFPALTNDDDVIEHLGYTTAYNHKTLTPNWVAYELTAEEAEAYMPRNDAFAQDEACHGQQAELSDYRRSGWDRGHMAPAADMRWSEQAMTESFLLTNMCPQNSKFNAGAWEKTEKMGRRIAKKYGKVYIVCGPIYDENAFGTIGANHVAIPDAFFKAFLIEVDGSYAAIGFKMNNVPEWQELKASSMSVDSLESIIGRDLFPNLPDDVENEIESKIVKKYWGI